MPVIAVVNAKGGAAKTTTSVYIAAAAVEDGYTVEVVDLDPQASALDWAGGAAAAGEPFPFAVTGASAHELRAWDSDADFVVLDTPPIIPDVIDAAVDAADFVVVVTPPEPAATRQAWKLIDSLEHRDFGVLFVNAEAGRRLLDETREAFESEGVPVFRGYVPRREAIKRSNGVGLELPAGLFGYKDLWRQLTAAPESEGELI